MKQFVIMKTLFLSLFLGTAFLFCSCSEDEEVPDVGTFSVDFTFNVFDNYGNNLLDPLNENNILSQDITATFKGKTGRLNEFVSFYLFYYIVQNKTITFGTLSEEDYWSLNGEMALKVFYKMAYWMAKNGLWSFREICH